jgi:hypothetical protein
MWRRGSEEVEMSTETLRLQFRRMVMAAALAGIAGAGLAAPAIAHDGWDDGWRAREWREHEWRRQWWREHEWRERHYYAPPAYYYAPPPVVYPPRPVYVPPPASFNFVLPLSIR